MDFYRLCLRESQSEKGVQDLFPDFRVGRSKDLMVRGRSFYAIWDEERNLWSQDEYDVQRLIDEDLANYADQSTDTLNVKYLRSFSNNGWSMFQKFIKNISDNAKQLDENLAFANTEVKKSDYVSRRLPYNLEHGDYGAWDELIGTLYSVEERAKIEWAIGAVVSGDAKKIQKFLVLYGPAGTGKSTILNIIEMLFQGYTTTFEAKALGSSNGSFATEVFKNNPLVAIQHDGDLSRIEDNTRLNSIISHEEMTMNEKYKASYTGKVNAFLFMGTNQPVKISDAKSGIIRRLIDVHPTGVKIPANHYNALMQKIEFELGAIAQHCLDVYREMGKNYYGGYRPTEMMLQTDVFFNFIEAFFDIFKEQDGTSLKQAYSLYKEYCGETGIEKMLPMYKVREELRNYFEEFHNKKVVDDVEIRSYYDGFTANKFKTPVKEDHAFSLVIEESRSLLDEELAACPAQSYRTNEFGDDVPANKWVNVTTTLSDIDTSDLHFVKVPENHIVIDFDLVDELGKKDLERNLGAASGWPATYAEISKGGAGIHLHYIYDGPDLDQLSSVYSEGIEIKVYRGNSSLRRRLSKCNGVPIAKISSGLPIKEKQLISEQRIKSEKGLRDLIDRNLRKEIHPGTKPSIDFINKILEDAHQSGMTYDVTDLRPKFMNFAMQSTNQSLQSLKIVQHMKLSGGDVEASKPITENDTPGIAFGGSAAAQMAVKVDDDRLVFYDVEVYPNLFVICWKFEGSKNIVKMVNPSSSEVETLFKLKLVGFNNRRYDNHIMYGRFMGMNNGQLYDLSKKIINSDRNSMFAEAYNLSYADIYDFSSLKQSLKKFQVQLGIRHLEMEIPWEEPVDPSLWDKVVEYCCNDVESTEAVFNARRADFVARQILAELSGLQVNDTTAKHTAKIVFGNDRNPQSKFVYTDLSKLFPGYVFDSTKISGKSSYKGLDPSEGGFVYAEPGMYENVAVLDVASMHPTSIINLNLFGEYTGNYADLLNARLAIKRGDYSKARTMLGGKLKPYLEDETQAKDLSYALKIVINIVYGLTSAKFDNPFRHKLNKDNIVAKRGALFMIDLKEFVESKGFVVAHIKTDSIKIPNATPEIMKEVETFGKKYGYDFEHEATYNKFCLVNDAVYIAQHDVADGLNESGKPQWKHQWDAVGAQFQHPYVYNELFMGGARIPEDCIENKQVAKGAMSLIYEDGTERYIGKNGRFIPVMPGSGGGTLLRIHEDKRYAVTGTKGHLWMEAELAEEAGTNPEVDMSYFEDLSKAAVAAIKKYGDFEEFLK